MDKFKETMEKMTSMSDADRKAMIEKNKELCICAKCPTYNDCAKDKMEGLFCVTSKSACTLEKKECICATCPVKSNMGLTHDQYCLNGSEKEQRGM